MNYLFANLIYKLLQSNNNINENLYSNSQKQK